MFSDQSFEPVGFVSQTSTDKSEHSVSAQTDKVTCQDSGNQRHELKNVETQTVTPDKPTQHVDYDKLAAFLQRVAPSVLNELDEIYGSTAFDSYDPGTSGEQTNLIELVAKFSTLSEADLEKKISCLTWSAGGGTLALAYSTICHDKWCDHLSRINFFNPIKEDQFSMITDKSLELNACVTGMSYHPTEPSILAAGLFNGDVLIWNLRDDETFSPLQLYSHGDTISVVQWRPKLVNNVAPLVTASRDGYIFVHHLTANFTIVELQKRFKISKEHNPSEKARPRSASGKRERAVEPGLTITALDFPAKDPTTFVVGTLCGGLYKCSINHGTHIDGSNDVVDPVTDEFERHQGSITALRFSANCDTFVTSGTDKEIRIYELSQFNSQHIIGVEDTVIGLSWLIGNADIFAAYGAGQTIAFYNLKTGRTVPNLVLETNGKETSCLQFNAKRDLVAIGDTTGHLGIWKIPRNAVS